MGREEASRKLDRYELAKAAEQRFESLSGGQQARFQILLLELSGATLLLLDEPTDNLDLESAEALEHGLDAFEGTVVAVTHDRWFARGFDRFLVFGADGERVRVGRAGLGRGAGRAGAMTAAGAAVDQLELLAADFVRLLSEADLAAPVPSCPGWTVADLAAHLGRDPPVGRALHPGAEPRRARHRRTGHRPGGTDHLVCRECRSPGPDPPGHRPEPECWTFGPHPRTAAFWFRRQVHETAMHRWDLGAAVGREVSYPAVGGRRCGRGRDHVLSAAGPIAADCPAAKFPGRPGGRRRSAGAGRRRHWSGRRTGRRGGQRTCRAAGVAALGPAWGGRSAVAAERRPCHRGFCARCGHRAVVALTHAIKGQASASSRTEPMARAAPRPWTARIRSRSTR